MIASTITDVESYGEIQTETNGIGNGTVDSKDTVTNGAKRRRSSRKIM
jgi:hypothetical protein